MISLAHGGAQAFMAEMLRCLKLFAGLLVVTAARGEWTPGEWRKVADLSSGVVAFEREVGNDGRRVRLTGVTFDVRAATFQVIDNPPASRVPLVTALISSGAIAGINGSYFHEDFRPLGLVASRGRILHAFERAKLLSGVLLVKKTQIELVRSSQFVPDSTPEEALQAGPWLLEGGTAVAGLNTERLARRSVVATDGKGHWALLVSDPVTLAEMSEILSLRDLPGAWTVKKALNLDGGSSTALAALSDSKPVILISSFGPVRNYLAIVPR